VLPVLSVASLVGFGSVVAALPAFALFHTACLGGLLVLWMRPALYAIEIAERRAR